MTKPPLERAARALCKLDGHPEDAKMEGKPLWQDYLPEACAVIEAIREPSTNVLLAMREPLGKHVDGYPVSHDNRDRWRAGIDALLAEGE